MHHKLTTFQASRGVSQQEQAFNEALSTLMEKAKNQIARELDPSPQGTLITTVIERGNPFLRKLGTTDEQICEHHYGLLLDEWLCRAHRIIAQFESEYQQRILDNISALIKAIDSVAFMGVFQELSNVNDLIPRQPKKGSYGIAFGSALMDSVKIGLVTIAADQILLGALIPVAGAAALLGRLALMRQGALNNLTEQMRVVLAQVTREQNQKLEHKLTASANKAYKHHIARTLKILHQEEAQLTLQLKHAEKDDLNHSKKLAIQRKRFERIQTELTQIFSPLESLSSTHQDDKKSKKNVSALAEPS